MFVCFTIDYLTIGLKKDAVNAEGNFCTFSQLTP